MAVLHRFYHFIQVLLYAENFCFSKPVVNIVYSVFCISVLYFSLSSFCEYPMASLHEGVFLERAHAEAYVSIFQPQLDDFEQGQDDRGNSPLPGL